MPLRSLKDIYEKRKSTLKSTLEHGNLDKERKAQINGAIAEIDTLLKTIETLRQQEIEDNRLLEMKGKPETSHILPLFGKFGDKNKKKFETSNTRHSLNEAFIKKCEARTRYELFGNIAKDEGYENIAKIFYETAANEREQARIILEFMKEEGNTITNLKHAADLEKTYHEHYHPRYEKISKEENYPLITEFFKELSDIDADHEKRFLKLLKSFSENKVFKKDIIVKWRCKECGYIVESHDAPNKCKVCKAHKGKFEVYHEVF